MVSDDRNIVKNQDRAINLINSYRAYDDPETILENVSELINKSPCEKLELITEIDLDFQKASTLNEFENSILMAETVPDEYRTFAINFYRSIVNDYNCQTASEKSTAELAAINYTKTIDLNKQIRRSLETHNALFYAHDPHPKGHFYGELSGRCLACERSKIEMQNRKLLSDELDRANRCYFTAIQTLRAMKQAPFQLNINTNFGQNQVIQNKNG